MKNRSSFLRRYKTITEGARRILPFALVVSGNRSSFGPSMIKVNKITGFWRVIYPILPILSAFSAYVGAVLYTGKTFPPLQPTLIAATVSFLYVAGTSSLDFCFDSKIDTKLRRKTPITRRQLTTSDIKFFYILLTIYAIVVSSLAGLRVYLLSLAFVPLSLVYSAGIRLSDHYILGNTTLIILKFSLPMLLGAVAVGGRLGDPLLIASFLLLLVFAVGVDLPKDLVKQNIAIDKKTGRRTLSEIIGRSGALAVSVSLSLLGALGAIFVINWLRVDTVCTLLTVLALLFSLSLTVCVSRGKISLTLYRYWSGSTYILFLLAFVL